MPPVSIDIKQVIQGDTNELRRLFEQQTLEINGGNQYTSPTADTPEMNTALEAIDNALARLAASVEITPATTPETLIANLVQQLRRHTIPTALRHRLYFAVRVFTHSCQVCDLDATIASLLCQHLPTLVKIALRDDRAYCSRGHSLYQLYASACRQAYTWYPLKGRIPQALPQRIATTLAELTQLPPRDSDRLAHLAQSLEHNYQQEATRATKAEKRCCESETGTIKVLAAQRQVISHINQSLAGRWLPASCTDFIQGALREELQYVVINQGREAPLWLRWRGILSSFSWMFVADRSQLDKQRLYEEVPRISSFLERTPVLQTCQPQRYREFADELGHILLLLLKNEPLGDTEVAPIPLGNELGNIKTRVSQTLLNRAEHLKEGDWFIFHNDRQQDIRIKLALKIPDTDQLLFTNRYGHKALQKSIEEFVLCLSSGIARPLYYQPPFTLALPLAITEHLQQLAREQATKAEPRREAHSHATATAATNSSSTPNQGKKNARQAAAIKAQREAAALVEPTPASAKKHNATLVEKLVIGAWVQLPAKDKSPMHCKLAVHIRSSGKYIFVDRNGTKVAEHNRESLMSLQQQGTFKLLKQGERFDDQLAKVIRGLRKSN